MGLSTSGTSGLLGEEEEDNLAFHGPLSALGWGTGGRGGGGENNGVSYYCIGTTGRG